METRAPSPPSPSDPPRRDRPTRQISDFSPNSPDHALRFTAIRASERFRGRVALPALSCPLPRTAAPKARAPNPRHDAPRRPTRPPRQSTKRPASTSRRALNSPVETASNSGRIGRPAPSHNPPSPPRPAGRPSIVSGLPGAGSADERHQELVELRDDRWQVRRVRHAHLAEEGCPLRLLHRIGPEGR